ncbi:MFS transporter [Novosphingobium album (ex Liu et al. 2023)]|uniref:MFS transporter n=1 Tax=Novosphingobium album (ex Liu et al. 2023) TaxID=3031130 RepID=A0ABT5WNM2_9SPHN|nr:MFS transporter [Novosphingobium album (ex Liu et al. 2023)]MDE8651635.1 MFS transporter [Novosphingobium album (ex Liu et al. 2023)]
MAHPSPARPGAAPYFAELREHRRAVAGASAGMAAGFLINHYVANLFAAPLIEEFGWSRADFALVGTIGLLSLVFVPLFGRLTDLVGARPVAAVGIVCFPLSFLAFSAMNGSLAMFVLISGLQLLFAAASTSSTVYSRFIAERFTRARGLALAIMATAPALVGVVGSPLLAHVIAVQGWRTGYVMVAVYTGVVGALALVLMPGPIRPAASRGLGARPARRPAAQAYAAILRTPAFWIVSGGFLMCNLLYPLQSSQMKLMLLEHGASSESAAWMISLLAAGVLFGRFACGLALDRFPPAIVAAIALGMPGVGLLAVAMGFDSELSLALAVAVMGLSLGAESDLAAYLVMRYFPMEVYGTVLGLVVACLAASATLGAVLLSVTLRLVDHFSAYMVIAGLASFAGGSLFLLLGRIEQPAGALAAQH